MEEQIKLYHGDCTELLPNIPTDSVDLVLCDLPYGVTDCAWDIALPLDTLWKEYRRVLRPCGTAVLFCVEPFTTHLINSNPAGFRYLWYWKKNNKTGAPFARVQPMRCIEEIAVFYTDATNSKRRHTYNPQGLVRLKKPKVNKPVGHHVYSAGKNSSVQEYTGYPHHLLEFNNEAAGKSRLHPTQKPVPLLEYLVRTYTNEGETVLDNCMGSGSTGVACIRAGRRFIGMEKDAHFFQIAKERIEKEAAHKELHT